MTDTLFPLEPVELEERPKDSADVRRTKRAARMILAERHPFGEALRDPAGETCGSCAKAERFTYHNRTYWKCPPVGGLTHGAGSDLRLKWPACIQWAEKAPTVEGTVAP